MKKSNLKIQNSNALLSREALENAGASSEIRMWGFTLLEVMVAVTIMSMVLVTLIGLKNSSMQNVTLAEHITTATMLAKRAMIEATATRPLLPAEDEGEFPESQYKGYSWKKTIVPTPLIQIMEVHVAVLWKEGIREESVELVSYE